jgi:hypothetical protein
LQVLGVLDDEKDTHSAASSDLADKSTSEQQMKQSDETFSLSLGSDEGKAILQQQSPVKLSPVFQCFIIFSLFLE